MDLILFLRSALENFIITVVFLFIGVLLKQIPRFPKETGSVLNLFVIYISLPAIVLLKIKDLSISYDVLIPAVMPWGMILAAYPIVIFLAKKIKWSRAVTGSLLLLVPLGNTSFLGIPMVKAFFGEKAIPYAVIYDQLGSFLALATYGSVVITIYGSNRAKIEAKDVIFKTVTFPPFIALIAALLLKPLEYPPVVINILSMLGSTLVPIVMIAVGYQLTLSISKGESVPMAIGIGLKLIILPLIAWGIYKAAGLSGTASQVAVFESGMAPMVSAGALAILYDLAPGFTAAMVGAGIILSFITLPLLFMLL